MHIRSPKILELSSFFCLAAALALSFPVMERLAAALRERHKFPGDGHIYLSAATGLVFSALVAIVFGLAFGLNHLAARQSAARSLQWSRWAMLVAVIVALGYWALGMSSLNVWRP